MLETYACECWQNMSASVKCWTVGHEQLMCDPLVEMRMSPYWLCEMESLADKTTTTWTQNLSYSVVWQWYLEEIETCWLRDRESSQMVTSEPSQQNIACAFNNKEKTKQWCCGFEGSVRYWCWKKGERKHSWHMVAWNSRSESSYLNTTDGDVAIA
jgi:hypothetical protein